LETESGERDFHISEFVSPSTATLALLDWPKRPGIETIKRKKAASTPNDGPGLRITAEYDCERTCPIV
jgi:hypothetical protein